jgi:hypothetical protein
MTATGAIQTAQHEGALLVPTRAIQTVNGQKVLQVQQAGQPPVAVTVETGLSSDGQTEILSCVDTGSLCLQEGDTLVVTASSSSSTSQTTRQGGLGGFGGPGIGGPPPGIGR